MKAEELDRIADLDKLGEKFWIYFPCGGIELNDFKDRTVVLYRSNKENRHDGLEAECAFSMGPSHCSFGGFYALGYSL
jgi:hypothetical protein